MPPMPNPGQIVDIGGAPFAVMELSMDPPTADGRAGMIRIGLVPVPAIPATPETRVERAMDEPIYGVDGNGRIVERHSQVVTIEQRAEAQAAEAPSIMDDLMNLDIINNAPHDAPAETRSLHREAAMEKLARAKELASKSEALLDKIARLRESVGDEFLKADEERCREEFDALTADIEREQECESP